MAPRASRRRSRCGIETLERRWNPAGLVGQPDIGEVAIPADASGFPETTLDVLANDAGSGLRIVSFSSAALGSVDRLPGAGAAGRDLLRYVPGPGFRGYDSFVYVVGDDAGHESTQLVQISYVQDAAPFAPWRIDAPDDLPMQAGETFAFTSPEGDPLVSIEYGGTLPARIGVLLRWSGPGIVPLAPAVGVLSSSAQPDDATFSPLPFGGAWLFGSIEGANALLAGMTFTPQPGFETPAGTCLTVQAHLYSTLNVNLGVELFDIRLPSISPPALPPIVVADEYVVRDVAAVSEFDVLANDVPNAPGRLQLVAGHTVSESGATVLVDQATGRLLYQPADGFIGRDTLRYTVRNGADMVSSGEVVVLVMPDLMAVARNDDGGPVVMIMNPDTGGMVSEFRPLDPTLVDATMDLADLDGDGTMEVVALRVDRDIRMQAFSMTGLLLEDTVIRPFGGRRVRDLDVALGDLDADGRAEMVVAGRTARGLEIRAIDAETGGTELGVVLRGMAGAPQIAHDDETDRTSVVGRSPGGALLLATVHDDRDGQADVSRRTVMTAREMRTLARANGGMADLAVLSADTDGDGARETVIAMAFRNGAMHAMAASGTGGVRPLPDLETSLDQTRLRILADDLGLTPDVGPVDTPTMPGDTLPARRGRPRGSSAG